MTGNVLRIFVADNAGEPMREVPEAEAVQGQGLAGDRYQRNEGTWSSVRVGQTKRHISLVEVEALEAVNGELEQPFLPEDTRRNILTRGISLNTLVGKEFLLGGVRVRGVELCDPCARPSKLSGKPGFKEAFTGRGGLRVEVLTNGLIRPGDVIQTVL